MERPRAKSPKHCPGTAKETKQKNNLRNQHSTSSGYVAIHGHFYFFGAIYLHCISPHCFLLRSCFQNRLSLRKNPCPSASPAICYWASSVCLKKNATIYELNVRQFSENGDFISVLPHLKRIKEMGIKIIWLMPIHPIGKKNRKGSCTLNGTWRGSCATPSLQALARTRRRVARREGRPCTGDGV